MIEEIKKLVEFSQCNSTAFERKMQFSFSFMFPVSPDSAEAQVL